METHGARRVYNRGLSADRRIPLRWTLLLLSCLFLPGCLQADLHCVLMPDGAGKLEFEIGVHQSGGTLGRFEW